MFKININHLFIIKRISFLASQNGDFQQAKNAIQNGADIYIADGNGYGAMYLGIILIYEIIRKMSNNNLFKATYYGYIDIVRALIQAGVDVDRVCATSYSFTALMAGIIDYF
jgi:hypothetical protein